MLIALKKKKKKKKIFVYPDESFELLKGNAQMAKLKKAKAKSNLI